MNRVLLEAAIAEKTGKTKKDVAAVIGAFTDVVTATLSNGEEVRLTGFGSFSVRQRKARNGKNPKTGEAISIPASSKPGFKAGKLLVDAVNK
jgi:DNA-binding protein HU-beta